MSYFILEILIYNRNYTLIERSRAGMLSVRVSGEKIPQAMSVKIDRER